MEGDQIEHIAIIGAGLMGLGIGLEFARFGYDVSLYNTTKETSDKAMDCCYSMSPFTPLVMTTMSLP